MRLPRALSWRSPGLRRWRCVPLVAPPYYAGLMVPFFGYAIALLGFNLLFGYTGLLSFGHAMFLGFGAYGAAVMAGVLGIKSFERCWSLVVLAAMAAALPIGLLCVRYVGIFFGMLTLAFGMLFHSFLFKFYHLTGGDSGMRVPRMNILGLEFAEYNKIEFLAGPFYYYCLALLVIAGLVMWRIVHSPFGLHLKAIRDNARKAEYLGVHVAPISAGRLRDLGRIRRRRRRHPRLSRRPGRSRAGVLDAVRPARVHGGARRLRQFLRADRRRARVHAAAGSAAVADAILALHSRRHPGADRDRLSRAASPGWPNSCGGGSRGARHDRAAGDAACQQGLRRVPRARRRQHRGARGRARVGGRARTAPARPRWSICSPACWRRPAARCCSWARALPASDRSSLPITAWRARFSSSRFSPS